MSDSLFVNPALFNPIPTKLKVIFCIPGNHFSNKFFISWSETLLMLGNKYDILISNQYSSQVNFARALCLGANVLNGPNQKPFNNGAIDYDIIVWLDSDMVFKPDMIDKLIQNGMQYKIYSGIYAMDGGTQLCCVEHWDEDYYKTNGCFKFVSVEEGNDKIKNNKQIVNCAYVGMGCMAIKKGVIEDERFKYPWFFRNITEFNNNGAIVTDGTSEDVSFIRNLVDSGIIKHIPVDLSLRFGHEKHIVY